MNLIGNLTDAPYQKVIVALDDGTQVPITLRYFEGQAGWFYSFVHPLLTINNRRLSSSPNMLRAFRGVINWGLSCTVLDGGEPVRLDDFKTRRVQFFTLNANDLATIESLINTYA